MQSQVEGTAVEVADSIPKLYPCGARLGRQARCSSAGRQRTKKRVRAAWPRPARSRRPEAGTVRDAPDSEEVTAKCAEQSWRSPHRKPLFKRFLACCITFDMRGGRRRHQLWRAAQTMLAVGRPLDGMVSPHCRHQNTTCAGRRPRHQPPPALAVQCAMCRAEPHQARDSLS